MTMLLNQLLVKRRMWTIPMHEMTEEQVTELVAYYVGSVGEIGNIADTLKDSLKTYWEQHPSEFNELWTQYLLHNPQRVDTE